MSPAKGDCMIARGDFTTLLNDFYCKTGTISSFPQFSSLPVEIKLMIWKQALCQNRLIKIGICDKAYYPFWESDEVEVDIENDLGRLTSGKNYRLRVIGDHVLTPLLRTSREARQAALEFYRVHVPYDLVRHGKQQCLYLNPEWDLIHIQIDNKGHPEVFASLVHDLKAYDPQSIGALNLGIGSVGPLDVELPLDPSIIPPRIHRSFVEVISGLQCIFYHCIPRGDTRVMYDSLNIEEVRFNRAYPINTGTEVFDFDEIDPRPIEAYLDKVGLGIDPRRAPWLWNKMERAFNITRSPGTTRFVYHLAAPGMSDRISSRKEAIEMLQQQHKTWRLQWGKEGFFGRRGYKDPDTPEALRDAPIPAFGFWIFPLNAFGELPGDGPEVWNMKIVVNLVKHHPQLGVFRLPRENHLQ